MSLNEIYDPNNIFAKIIRGDMPCVKVFEDGSYLAFMDIFPQTEGHCLVIPKTEGATNLLTAPASMLSGLIETTRKVAAAVVAALEPDGVRIAQFNGSLAGQTVFHLHMHILPVYEGRSIAPHAGGSPASAEALELLADKIRRAM
ncbi:MAG: HIT domain-containing protein [Alphaproteobacteria bacterium]|nr:HIT domain-containing protein [Alphaproteobacteria bacterium]